MKKFLKRLMFMFVLMFGLTGLVACEKTPNDPPPTQQEAGTGESQTGSGNSNTPQQSSEDQSYSILNTHAKALTNKSTADYESVTNGELVTSGTFNKDEFLAKNAAFVEAVGGANSPTITSMITQMAPMSEYFTDNVKSKTIGGYKGSTKEGYYERHVYNAELEKYNMQDACHTIKDGNNLINYEFDPYSEITKSKKYIGEDWAPYAYFDNKDSALNTAGISFLANNNSFTAYKSCLFDLMINSLPITINCNIADYSTVTSSITNDNGNYLLKNHVVFNRLPGEMYDMNMELVGTGDMDIYFTANKITKIVLDFDVDALAVMEIEESEMKIYVPFDMIMESNMETFINDYNTTTSANATYLASFVATGTDKDLDGNPDIENTKGGYLYNLCDLGGINNVADFGEEIEPKTATEIANTILNSEDNSDIKNYYNTENLIWYTDYECTQLADAELVNKTTAPSYLINLYTKVPLKSNYVKINLYITDGDEFGDFRRFYLEVPSSQDSVTIDIETIKNNYLFNDTVFGLASNSIIAGITVNENKLTSNTFEVSGGQECELTFLLSKVSYVEDNEVKYIVRSMTQSQYEIYQSSGEFSGYYNEITKVITNYDPNDDSTHSYSYAISTLLEDIHIEEANATAIYINDTLVATTETIIKTGGSTTNIIIIVSDTQE